MQTKLKPGDEIILDSLFDEMAQQDMFTEGSLSCELREMSDILMKTEMLGGETTQLRMSMYIIQHGFVPLLANFFLLGMRFAALQKDSAELEQLYKK